MSEEGPDRTGAAPAPAPAPAPAKATAAAPTPGKRILVFVDPMCSWCWGFAPVLAAIVAGYADRAAVKLVVGGLRPFTATAMTDQDRTAVRHHWDEVAAATGQPFDFAFFDRPRFVYDTEPACRAVVAIRFLAPDLALGYFDAVQQAFYAANRDVTDALVLADLAAGLGVDRQTFARAFTLKDVIAATRADFHAAQSLGIAGFPSVVLADDDGYLGLTMGWQPFDQLRPTIEGWINS